MKNKAAGSPGQPGPREKTNGAPAAGAGRRRAALKPSADLSSDPRARETDQLASFSELAPRAVGAPAWPVHLALWLEPDLPPPLPKTSGLRVERSHKIPARSFLGTVEPFGGSPVPIAERSPVIPNLQRRVPSSGLRPLGWEPRSLLAARLENVRRSSSDTEKPGREGGQ